MRLPRRKASAAAAGTVEVRFVNTGSYAEAGVTAWEEEAKLQAIARRTSIQLRA